MVDILKQYTIIHAGGTKQVLDQHKEDRKRFYSILLHHVLIILLIPSALPWVYIATKQKAPQSPCMCQFNTNCC